MTVLTATTKLITVNSNKEADVQNIQRSLHHRSEVHKRPSAARRRIQPPADRVPVAATCPNSHLHNNVTAKLPHVCVCRQSLILHNKVLPLENPKYRGYCIDIDTVSSPSSGSGHCQYSLCRPNTVVVAWLSGHCVLVTSMKSLYSEPS